MERSPAAEARTGDTKGVSIDVKAINHGIDDEWDVSASAREQRWHDVSSRKVVSPSRLAELTS